MSNRTRSNPNFEKMPATLHSAYTVDDRLKIMSELASVIADRKKELAKELSYKTPDARLVAKCNEIIQNCVGTVKRELRNVGIQDETMISEIANYVKNNELKKAYNNVKQIVSQNYHSMACNIR